MARSLRLDIELLPEGLYLGTSPDVPGLTVEADTVAEAQEIAADLSPVLLAWHEGAAPGELIFETHMVVPQRLAAE